MFLKHTYMISDLPIFSLGPSSLNTLPKLFNSSNILYLLFPMMLTKHQFLYFHFQLYGIYLFIHSFDHLIFVFLMAIRSLRCLFLFFFSISKYTQVHLQNMPRISPGPKPSPSGWIIVIKSSLIIVTASVCSQNNDQRDFFAKYKSESLQIFPIKPNMIARFQKSLCDVFPCQLFLWPHFLLLPQPSGTGYPALSQPQGSACCCFCLKQSSLLWLPLSLFSGFSLRCHSLREDFNYAFIFQPTPENFPLFFLPTTYHF